MKLVQSEEASWQYAVKSGSATPVLSWSLQAGDIVWRGIWEDYPALCCKRLPGESCSCDHATSHLCPVFTVAQVKLCNPCGTSCVQLCSSALHVGGTELPLWYLPLLAGCWQWTGWRCLGWLWHWESSYGLCYFSCVSPVCCLRGSDCPRLSLLREGFTRKGEDLLLCCWEKQPDPLRSLRFLIFENNIPSICCELRGVGEGKGDSYMMVSELFCSRAVAGTSRSCSTSPPVPLSPAPLPCTGHSCPAPTNATLWEAVKRWWGWGMVPRVREMQLWLLGNMSRLWLSPSLHVGFESWRLLSHCRTGCSYSAFCINSHAVTVQLFSGWCWMKSFVMCRLQALQHTARSCSKCLPRYFLQLQWHCCSWFCMRKWVINRIYCWFISTVCTNSRSQSELQLICLWFILSSLINWRTSGLLAMLKCNQENGIRAYTICPKGNWFRLQLHRKLETAVAALKVLYGW